jgi:RNA polymerase sigma-70 factor (ECF subfamily)
MSVTLTTSVESASKSHRTEDAELIATMASGDEDAFRVFYRRHSAVAFHLARRILRDRSLAEDAVQEAFFVAWRQATSYDPARSKPTTWLLTFVHRRAVDLVRKSSRHAADPLEHMAPESLGVEDHTVQRVIDVAWVRQALDRLPARDREILELAYFNGLTQMEIARAQGIPLGTVKSRTMTALDRLRDSTWESAAA